MCITVYENVDMPRYSVRATKGSQRSVTEFRGIQNAASPLVILDGALIVIRIFAPRVRNIQVVECSSNDYGEQRRTSESLSECLECKEFYGLGERAIQCAGVPILYYIFFRRAAEDSITQQLNANALRDLFRSDINRHRFR